MPRPWSLPSLGSAFALALVSGCSLINSVGEINPGGGGAAGTTVSGSTGTGPECTVDANCSSLDSDCHKGTCDPSGKCVATVQPVGTACGNTMGTDCDAADTCDANAMCLPNVAADGAFCADCPAGPGLCALCKAGACGDCTTRAKSKTFRTPSSTTGWTFTGSWHQYEQTPAALAPSGNIAGPFIFAHPVVGTDGNRAHPYPGKEIEVSSATSPPSKLGTSLTFKSWNYDEGNAYDQKKISVSVDGGASFTVVATCPQSGFPFPFCHTGGDGIAGTWQDVVIDFNAIGHPELSNKVGIVRFQYLTADDLIGFELGWYIDELNFATDCACATNMDCAAEDGMCSTGICDLTNNECALTPKNNNMPCGDTADKTCSAPDTCDQFGFCNPNSDLRDGVPCDACAEGSGLCLACGGGVCMNCPPLQVFDPDLPPSQLTAQLVSQGWSFSGSWSAYNGPPPATASEQPQPFFPDGDGALPNANVLGTDGVKVAPYYNPAFVGTASETSYARTPTVVIPDNITFKSWHRDRGGNGNGVDIKKVRITIDAGTNWTTILDCNGGINSSLPLCTQRMSPPLSMWDDISLPTNALAGKSGIVEFSYESVDAGFEWEGGWYIDDVNVGRCGDH